MRTLASMATAGDGVRLHVEECGTGEAIVFAHEFGGDHRSWEPQLRQFHGRYRCVTFGARGYPPSDVPTDPAAYSQERARDDLLAVLDHLGIGSAHLVGLSMGSFTCLHVALAAPERVRSVVLAGCGWGSTPGDEERFRAECEAAARAFEADTPAAAARHAEGPSRVQLQRKDRSRWNEFRSRLALHPPMGAAHTLRGVQMRRPLLGSLLGPLRSLDVPVLVLAGDEDDRSLEPSLLLKRTIPRAGLEVFPRSGHTLNLEDPARFHRALEGFLLDVESGAWEPRDPRSMTAGFLAGPVT